MPHDHRDAEKTSMDGCCTVDGLVSLGGVRFRVSYSCAHTGGLISQCLIMIVMRKKHLRIDVAPWISGWMYDCLLMGGVRYTMLGHRLFIVNFIVMQ